MSAEEEVPDDPEQIVGNPEAIKVLKRVAKTVSSQLGEGEAEVKAEQACFLPCTDDSVPVIGEVPGIRGCYVATGHSCWGILNGPATLGLGHPGDYQTDRPCPQFVKGAGRLGGHEQASCG